ncbi:MAG: LCP family protein [Erysipelotrichaceae bacterium]|nr:LCP family protein [Erysipelotrichaceae bacterium]
MNIKKLLNYKLFVGLQIIVSIVLIGSLLFLDILPTIYIGIIITVIALLCLLTFFLMKSSEKKLRSIIGKLLSIVISIVMIIGSVAVNQGRSALSNVVTDYTQTTQISVYVLSDSEYEKASDLEGKTIEAVLLDDYMDEAITALKEENSLLEISDIDDYTRLVEDLYNGDTDAIYINEGLSATFDEIYEDYESDTKIIYTYSVIEETDDISKDVDVTNSSFNIFISGIDTYGPVSTVSRSDVNMIVTVNPITKQILLTSIPRDYYVTLANKGVKDKLTHAGLAGVENSVTTLENFLSIEINYYARVNFTSLVTMVDALGGIDVYSDTDLPNKGIVEGTNHMDGAMALAFSRERYAYTSGDNHRVQNQQAVLTAMLNKMMSTSVITNYSSILDACSGTFETNMSESEITSLIKMQISDMASWDIEQIQLTGTGSMLYGGAYMPSYKLYYMIPDDDSVNECVTKINEVMNKN